MERNVAHYVEKIVPDMIELRKIIHQNPEPAYEEHETGRIIAEYLEKIDNISVQRGVGGTGVVAHIGKENTGRCIALRADMDCLRMCEQNTFAHASKKQGLMHGCGHDGHIACLVGAALVLGELQKQLTCSVKCIFQPAEENYAGAEKMIQDGVLQNPRPQAIFGLHGTPSLPLGYVGTRVGPMMAASKYFTIVVKGKGTHAAMPHKGVDSVLTASQIVCAVHTIVARNVNPLEAALISIPKFTGSTAPNVMPSEVVLEGTLRALSNETRDFLQNRMRQVVEQVAASNGAEAEILFDGGYPLLKNEEKFTEYVVETAATLLGSEKIRDDYPPSLGSEDFAFYLEEIPGSFFWLGLGINEQTDAPLHNPYFDFNDDAIPLGIRLFCDLILKSDTIPLFQ